MEQLKSLPKTSYAHVMQARYWEAKELVSFVLRQVNLSFEALLVCGNEQHFIDLVLLLFTNVVCGI